MDTPKTTEERLEKLEEDARTFLNEKQLIVENFKTVNKVIESLHENVMTIFDTTKDFNERLIKTSELACTLAKNGEVYDRILQKIPEIMNQQIDDLESTRQQFATVFESISVLMDAVKQLQNRE